jgi:hypothetical protein
MQETFEGLIHQTMDANGRNASRLKIVDEGLIEFDSGEKLRYAVLQAVNQAPKRDQAFIDKIADRFDVNSSLTGVLFDHGLLHTRGQQKFMVDVNIVYVYVEVEPHTICAVVGMRIDWEYMRDLAGQLVKVRWLYQPLDPELSEQMSADLWYLLVANPDVENQIVNLYADDDDDRTMTKVQRDMATTMSNLVDARVNVDELWHRGEHWAGSRFPELVDTLIHTEGPDRTGRPVMTDPSDGLVVPYFIIDTGPGFIVVADQSLAGATGIPYCKFMAVFMPSVHGGVCLNMVGGADFSACRSVIATIIDYTSILGGRLRPEELSRDRIATVLANLTQMLEIET